MHWTINAIALSWRLVVVNDLPFIPSFLGLRENHLIYIPMKHMCRSNVGFYIHIGGWSWIHSHTDLDTRKKHWHFPASPWRHGITRKMSMKHGGIWGRSSPLSTYIKRNSLTSQISGRCSGISAKTRSLHIFHFNHVNLNIRIWWLTYPKPQKLTISHSIPLRFILKQR